MAGLLVALCFVVGGQTLWFDFAFDDSLRIPFVAEVGSLTGAFQHPSWPGNLYRPLETVTFILTRTFLDSNPVYFHLENLLIHALTSVVVYFLLKNIVSPWVAKASSILFAVHPLHSEVIANISYRSESLAALGVLLTCYCSLRFQSAKHSRLLWIICVLCSAFLAVFSKENGLHVLLLCPLCIWYIGTKEWRKSLAIGVVIATVASLSLIGRAVVLNQEFLVAQTTAVHDNPLCKLDKGMQVWNALILLGRYATLSIFPFHVSAVSSFPKIVPLRNIEATSLSDALFLALLSGVVIATLIGLKKRSSYSFWGLWFLCSLALTSNIVVPVGTIFADRLAYLAVLSGCGFIAEISSKIGYRSSVIIVSIFVAIYGIMCIKAVSYWRNDLTLFGHESVQSPRNSLAHGRFGAELYKVGRYDEAREQLQEGIRLYPKNIAPLPYLAATELATGNKAQAMEYTNQYLAIFPDDVKVKRFKECMEKVNTESCQFN